MRSRSAPTHGRRTALRFLFALLAPACSLALPPAAFPRPSAAPPPGYADSLRAHREARIARLRSPQGWLAVAGLYWLMPGENGFGTDSSEAVVLPPGTAPGRAGVFILRDGASGPEVTVRANPGAGATLDGKPVTERKLRADDTGSPDRLRVGRLELWVIRRGPRTALRMRDPESPILRNFTGVEFYPPDPAYRVVGRLRRADPPLAVPMMDMVGIADTVLSPGRVAFTLGGRAFSLTPIYEDDSDTTALFFVFQDATSGDETYGAGRFLDAGVEPDGSVLLDFNYAYNPPCAFNPYTTCPLPPAGNVLPAPVRAGEKAYAGADH